MRSVIIVSTLVAMCLSVVDGMSVCVNTSPTDNQHPVLMSNNDNTSRKNNNNRNIMYAIQNDRRFTRLVRIIEQAGSSFRNNLEQQGRDKTLLAPTNEAFQAMEETLNVRVENMDRNDLNELLKYHIIPKRAINVQNLYNGDLLETALDNQKGLGGRRQVIRVNRIGNRVALNMYSRIVESDIQTENGVVQAVSEVMQLPRPLFEGMTILPSMFSTHAMALTLTGLDKKVDRATKMTALIATNEAWESMGFVELMELFLPENRAELKQMMLKHFIPEVAYVQHLASQKGMSEAQCARDQNEENNNNNENNVVRKSFNTWADEQVILRVVCRGGELRTIVDESTVSVQDLPAENGVAHLLTSPIVVNKNKRHRRNPNNGMTQRKNQNRKRRTPRFTSIFEEEMMSMGNRRDRREPNYPRHPRHPRNGDNDDEDDQDDMTSLRQNRRDWDNDNDSNDNNRRNHRRRRQPWYNDDDEDQYENDMLEYWNTNDNSNNRDRRNNGRNGRRNFE